MTRRIIKVGGGYLHSSRYGDIEIPGRAGKPITIQRVYYVPNLGANLLSCRRLCTLGLRGEFDVKAIKLFNLRNECVLRARHSEGVYIVEWIDRLPKRVSNTMHSYWASAFWSKDSWNKRTTSSATSSITVGKRDKDFVLMHRRFGHMGNEVLRNIHHVTDHGPIQLPNEKHICSSCQIGKITQHVNHTVAERRDNILDSVSCDTCGPFPKSISGNAYFVNLVDNATRRRWTIPVPDRKSIPERLDAWKSAVELQTDRKLKALRVDNALEFNSLLTEWGKKWGILQESTEPYTSHQNGIAERSIRTTEEAMRTLLADAKLPIEFWDEAATMDTYLRNRITTNGPTIDGNMTSPQQAIDGKRSEIGHIRIWGCKCYAYVNPKSLPAGTRHDKLMPRGREAVLVGFDPLTTKQYRVYAPDLRRIIKASSVVFDEHTPGGEIDLNLKTITPNVLPTRKHVGRPKLDTDSVPVAKYQGESIPITESRPRGESIPATESKMIAVKVPFKSQSPDGKEFEQEQEHKKQENTQENTDSFKPADIVPMTSDQGPATSPMHGMKRRRDSEPSGERTIKHLRSQLAIAMGAIKVEQEKDQQPGPVPIPKTYHEAINDPTHGKHWAKAFLVEIKALELNNTWRAEVPPKDANIVTSKWVLSVKYNPDGSINKYKARIVARGFSQVKGIDYNETFAPTVKMDTLRTILGLIAVHNLETGQADVNNAFTESTLKWSIYMNPPPGVEVEEDECLRLLQSLYGLKQAASDWYQTCSKELVQLGFTSSISDPCMFLNKERSLIVLVYVDDISITSPHKQQITWFKAEFAKRFKIKDLGELTHILGMTIERDRAKRTLTISQCSYVRRLLKDLLMEEDTHRKATIPMNGYDSIQPATDEEARIDKTEYARIIGTLMHLMVYTRPDIAFALGKLSQFMKDPTAKHGHGIKALLRYIRSSCDRKITYGKGEPKLIGFSDADYAADKADRKSTLGQVFMFAGGPVSWASKKQKSVATSTTEAEYMALSECSRQALWFKHLFEELGYPTYAMDANDLLSLRTPDNEQAKIELKGDNMASLKLVKNNQVCGRLKHIDVAYHFIRNLQQDGQIDVSYISTDDMIADGLTKPLGKVKFQRFVDLLGMN